VPIAVTRGNALIADINRVLLQAPRHVSSDDFWFRRVLVEAEKLKATSRHEAHNVLAQLYGIAGDAEQAEHHINTAIHLRYDYAYICNKAVVLSNLGFFSKARAPFMQAVDPRHGLFTSRWNLGICLGCFHALARFDAQARQMNLENIEAVDSRLIGKAVRMLDDIQLSEETLAGALDVVGEMLRENKLFFVGSGPNVFVWDEDPLEHFMSMVFKVRIPVADAIGLDEELGERLHRSCYDLPSEFMIHFESAMAESDERRSERPALAG
jgi:hypothetical protein